MSKTDKSLIFGENNISDWNNIDGTSTIVALSADIDRHLTSVVTISGDNTPEVGDICLWNDNGTVQGYGLIPFEKSNSVGYISGVSDHMPAYSQIIQAYRTTNVGYYLRCLSYENNILTNRKSGIEVMYTGTIPIYWQNVAYDSDLNKVVVFYGNNDRYPAEPVYPYNPIKEGEHSMARVGTPSMSGDASTIDVEMSAYVCFINPDYIFTYQRVFHYTHYNSIDQKVFYVRDDGYTTSYPVACIGHIIEGSSPSGDVFEVDYEHHFGSIGKFPHVVYSETNDYYVMVHNNNTYTISISGDSLIVDTFPNPQSLYWANAIATIDNVHDKIVVYGDNNPSGMNYYIADITESGFDWTGPILAPVQAIRFNYTMDIGYDPTHDIWMIILDTGSYQEGYRFQVTVQNEMVFGSVWTLGFDGAANIEWLGYDVGHLLVNSVDGNYLFINNGSNLYDNFAGIYQGVIGSETTIGRYGYMDTNQSGLTINTNYYIDEYGRMTSDSNNDINPLVGKAVSDTEIIIKG